MGWEKGARRSDRCTKRGSVTMDSIQTKLVAFVLMVLDHAGALFLPTGSSAWVFARGAGRLAFPLYAYLASQGIWHTRSITAYSGRLFLYAFLSEFFFDVAFFDQAPFPAYQNTFFTLALAVAAFWPCRPEREKRPSRPMKCGKQPGQEGAGRATYALCALSVLCAGAAAKLIHADYGLWGVLLTGAMVAADRHRLAMMAAVWCFLFVSAGWLAPNPLQRAAMAVAATSVWAGIVRMNNGKPGDKRMRKWFYAAYPAHLIVLWLMRIVAAA